MSKKWGTVDFKQLQELQKRLDKILSKDIDKFVRDCAKELTARLLAAVIKSTPVGKYPKVKGSVVKKGGTLRRGWTVQSEQSAESGVAKDAKSYAYSLNITKNGDVYEVEVINPVHYAGYVEFGHRTKNGKGWVEGRFMLTVSEKEIESQAPKILEKNITKFLGECFDA